MKIDSAAIKKLASLLEETGLNEIEVAEGDSKIRVKKQGDVAPVSYASAPVAAAPAAAAAAPALTVSAAENHPGAVTSPMVGTCYVSPEPGAPPFARKGETIKAGDTVCIIEAMKVMNPIKSTVSGIIKEVFIRDAQPVEYGDVLIVVE